MSIYYDDSACYPSKTLVITLLLPAFLSNPSFCFHALFDLRISLIISSLSFPVNMASNRDSGSGNSRKSMPEPPASFAHETDAVIDTPPNGYGVVTISYSAALPNSIFSNNSPANPPEMTIGAMSGILRSASSDPIPPPASYFESPGPILSSSAPGTVFTNTYASTTGIHICYNFRIPADAMARYLDLMETMRSLRIATSEYMTFTEGMPINGSVIETIDDSKVSILRKRTESCANNDLFQLLPPSVSRLAPSS
jgi:hypothetical protein